MAFILFGLFCALFAEEVVELVPVEAPGNNPLTESVDCNLLTAGGSGGCWAELQCMWDSSLTTPKCVQDPCFKYIDGADDVACASPCAIFLTPSGQRKDCSDGSSTHFCAHGSASNSVSISYCDYAWIKSGRKTCPSPACHVGDVAIGSGQSKKCVANTVSTADACSSLDDKACPLNPKCYWNTTAPAQCWADECFTAGVTEDQNCASILSATCTDFKPFKDATTAVFNYCVNKAKNTKPNLCYFLGGTYSINSLNPTCTGDIATCNANENCATFINKQGSYAGQYCDDKNNTHGGSSILRIPTLLALLLVLISIFSF